MTRSTPPIPNTHRHPRHQIWAWHHFACPGHDCPCCAQDYTLEAARTILCTTTARIPFLTRDPPGSHVQPGGLPKGRRVRCRRHRGPAIRGELVGLFTHTSQRLRISRAMWYFIVSFWIGAAACEEVNMSAIASRRGTRCTGQKVAVAESTVCWYLAC